MNTQYTIGLFFGGPSEEHEVSLRSVREVFAAFPKEKYKIVPIGIDINGKWRKLSEKEFLLLTLQKQLDFSMEKREESPLQILKGVDVAFPVGHGKYMEDGVIQAIFEHAGVPYVGCGVMSSALCMDKDLSKRAIRACGIATARYVALRSSETFDKEAIASFTYPLFVKPARAGSSIGITRVECLEEIDAALDIAFGFDEKVVIEEGVVGKEIEVSVLGNENIEVSLPGRVLPNDAFYSFSNKIADGALFELPAKLEREVEQNVLLCAKSAYRALDCEGLARIDLFVTEEGTVYFNEANTLPGFTCTSLYPKLWEISGKPYPELLETLVSLALERSARSKQYRHSKNKFTSSSHF